MKSKAVKKILLSVVSLLLVATIAFFGNAFFGNPVSKMLATNAAQKHLAEAYPDTDYEIERTGFDFKSTSYNVHIVSQSSIDSSFTLMYDMTGRLLGDSYEYRVLERGNTAERIRSSYREKTDAIFESKPFTFETHIEFGEIEFSPEQYKNEQGTPEYVIITDMLELDREYDINEFAKKAGHLTVYANGENVSAERLAQMLTELRTVFDKAGVSFYAVDFVLEYPKQEDGTQKDGRVEVMSFLYKDIYEDGLVERVKESNQKAVEYYAEQDAAKEAEISASK